MARDHARIDLRIWSDVDFCALSLPAKAVYFQLVSQQRLSYAGVLDLAVKRWARPHPDVDTAGVRAALSELDAARFVVIDQDTEELLVRTFIRNDELYKQPNVLHAALRQALEIESPILRAALAAELRRLPAEITGPAPAVAADALESGARELTPEVKAAMTIRGSGRPPATPRRDTEQPSADAPAPSVLALVKGSPNPSGNPSPNRCAKDLGEGSRERETGVTPLPLRSKKVGGRAPTRGAHAARIVHTQAPAPDDADHTTGESGSARQRRRSEAVELVARCCPVLPARVAGALVTEVLPMLNQGIGTDHIVAGLRRWAGKSLPVGYVAEFVGESMRAHLIARSDEETRKDAEIAATFEMARQAAIAEDDQSQWGRALRAEVRHVTGEQLQAIMDTALDATLAGER